MADEREQIAESILAVLRGSAVSLKAREIADALHGLGLLVTRTTVNSVLYNELSRGGRVRRTLNTGGPCPAKARTHWLPPRSLKDKNKRHPMRHRGATICIRQRRSVAPPDESYRYFVQERHRAELLRRYLLEPAHIEQEVYSRTDSLLRDGTKGDMVVIAADWGFGKSHMRMLLSSHLSEQGIPFVHECIDARAASLSHIHRSVPRWLEHIQFGRTVGLRDALNNGILSTEKALEWAASNYSDFAYGLRAALGGYEWGWLRALGHLYRAPDYPYQHLKAWSLVEAVATFLNKMNRGGLVLLLDEAENIDKQYDIRGRRKSYEMLARMTRHPHILPLVFVTDRLLYQVEQDYENGVGDGWSNWSPEAKWFVGHFRELQPLRRCA